MVFFVPDCLGFAELFESVSWSLSLIWKTLGHYLFRYLLLSQYLSPFFLSLHVHLCETFWLYPICLFCSALSFAFFPLCATVWIFQAELHLNLLTLSSLPTIVWDLVFTAHTVDRY